MQLKAVVGILWSEHVIYPLTKAAMKGGLAHGKPASSFNKAQLQKGTKVELEHTNSKIVARDIAKDHLVEDSRYYTHLEQMEKKHKNKASSIKEQKVAGLAESGMAALFGIIFGKAARLIPALEAARVQHPAMYDAALSAAVVAAVERTRAQSAIQGFTQGSAQGGPLQLPDSRVGLSTLSPGWNFM